MRESNSHQRITKPLYCHYTNAALLVEDIGIEPITLPCKGSVFPLALIPQNLLPLASKPLRTGLAIPPRNNGRCVFISCTAPYAIRHLQYKSSAAADWHQCKDLNPDKQFWRLPCYRYTTLIYRGRALTPAVCIPHTCVCCSRTELHPRFYRGVRGASTGTHKRQSAPTISIVVQQLGDPTELHRSPAFECLLHLSMYRTSGVLLLH